MTIKDVANGLVNVPTELKTDAINAIQAKIVGRVLVLISIILGIAMFVVMLQDDAREQMGQVLILGAGTVGFMLVAGVFYDQESRWDRAFEEYEKAIRLLRVNPDLFTKESLTDQRVKVHARLRTLGSRWYSAELAHPGEMEHIDRLDAKKAFEDTYRVFLQAGLIEDVGYGEFISKA